MHAVNARRVPASVILASLSLALALAALVVYLEAEKDDTR
jgi:hypothetical protein